MGTVEKNGETEGNRAGERGFRVNERKVKQN